MKQYTNGKKRSIRVESLDVSSLVAVKSVKNTVVLMYTEEWDKIFKNFGELGRLCLPYISREFKVRNNSITLDREFNEYLGEGHVDIHKYPRGIILQTHDATARAAA